ncbi:MAG: hypothetical protein WA971_03390 [Microbacterium sp.]
MSSEQPAETVVPGPGPERRERGWWRRNALSLVAMAVLLPATIGAISWQEFRFFHDYRPTEPVLPDAEGIVDLAGAEWGPVKAVVIEDTTGLTVPEGSKVIAVAVPVAPHPLAAGTDPEKSKVRCDAPQLVEQSTGRQWSQMLRELGFPYQADEPTDCVLQEGDDPFRILVPFVVPEDVEGPFWIDVPTTRAYPEFPRLPVDP